MKRLSFISALLGIFTALFLTGAVMAQTSAKEIVDQAKARGVVGEQIDGYLGFVRPPEDPAVRAAVAEINAGRAQVYREAAARNGVTVAAAGAAAYKQVVQSRLKPGEYYQLSDGSWVRK